MPGTQQAAEGAGGAQWRASRVVNPIYKRWNSHRRDCRTASLHKSVGGIRGKMHAVEEYRQAAHYGLHLRRSAPQVGRTGWEYRSLAQAGVAAMCPEREPANSRLAAVDCG